MSNFTVLTEADKPEDFKNGEVIWSDGQTIGVATVDDGGDPANLVRAVVLAEAASVCDGRFASTMDEDRTLPDGSLLPRLSYTCVDSDKTYYHVISFYSRPNDEVIIVRHLADTRKKAKSGDEAFFNSLASYQRGI